MENKIIKILFTLFVAILIPVYWQNYGPTNFLWLSDIGLFLTVFGLWLRSSLLMSMAAVGILPVELAWNVDYFAHLISGHSLIGIAGYMFDPRYSLFLRSLSLFHVVMPIVWISYVRKWGYDERAIKYWIRLYFAAIFLSACCTVFNANINWVFSPKIYHWTWIDQTQWFIFFIIILPVFVFWLMHQILKRMFVD